MKPKTPKRKTRTTFVKIWHAKNIAKCESAKRYCANNNMEFKIITEKDE